MASSEGDSNMAMIWGPTSSTFSPDSSMLKVSIPTWGFRRQANITRHSQFALSTYNESQVLEIKHTLHHTATRAVLARHHPELNFQQKIWVLAWGFASFEMRTPQEVQLATTKYWSWKMNVYEMTPCMLHTGQSLCLTLTQMIQKSGEENTILFL